MSRWRSARRFRRGYRMLRREMFGMARTVRYDLSRLERPGHARRATPGGWDGTDWKYRRLVTPVAFTMLFLGAVTGSYYAAAGGLFAGSRTPHGSAFGAPQEQPSVAPTPQASTATPPPVTVLPATAMPATSPSTAPSPGGSRTAGGAERPAATALIPSGSGPATDPATDPAASATGSPSPAPSGTPSLTASPTALPSAAGLPSSAPPGAQPVVDPSSPAAPAAPQLPPADTGGQPAQPLPPAPPDPWPGVTGWPLGWWEHHTSGTAVHCPADDAVTDDTVYSVRARPVTARRSLDSASTGNGSPTKSSRSEVPSS